MILDAPEGFFAVEGLDLTAFDTFGSAYCLRVPQLFNFLSSGNALEQRFGDPASILDR